MSQTERQENPEQHPAPEGGVLCIETAGRTSIFSGRWPALTAAFVSGFAVMSLELLEARLMAPFFGTSILVWTNIIGVILAAMALGAWAGGVAADKHPRFSTVAAFLLAAGAWAVGLSAVGRIILAVFVGLPAGWVVPLSACLLFAPPSFLLGAVAPAVLRLTVAKVDSSGQVAGLLAAVGTLGSLAGTYVTGYLLLPRSSVTDLIAGIGAGLIVCGILLYGRKCSARTLAAAACIGLTAIPGAYLGDRTMPGKEVPSAYNYVAVEEGLWEGTPARILLVNSGYHSAASLATPDESIFDYVKSFHAIDEVVPDAGSLLLVGGGGMHAASEFTQRHPGSEATVLEIDPAVYGTALKAFGPIDTSRITTIVDDARPAMGRLKTAYDAVVVDAYGGDHCVPWQLLTREAVAEYARLTKPNGVWAANIIMPPVPEGQAGRRFAARLVGTLRTSFAWVLMFSMQNGKTTNIVSNTLVMAGKGAIPDAGKIEQALKTKYGLPRAALIGPFDPGKIWTDDEGQADYDSLAMYDEARRLMH